MKLDQQYIKTIFDNNTLSDFLRLVEEGDIDDSRTRAIVSTLRRSARNLHLELHPIIEPETEKNKQETNQPQQP